MEELIAPETACPGQSEESLPASSQEQAMSCMIDFARAQVGEAPLNDVSSLEDSSADKAADIIGCDEFSHTACGREFTYWFSQDGYGKPGGCGELGVGLQVGTLKGYSEAHVWVTHFGTRC